MPLCPECGMEILDCQCSMKDGECLEWTGSGNGTPLSLVPKLDPDPLNILTWSDDGLLVKLPATIRIPPACHAYHSSNQSIPNEDRTVVSLNSERYDNDTMHDTSTNNSRITFMTPGIYVCTFNCSWAGNVTGDRAAAIRLNGKDLLGENAKPPPNSASIECGHSVTIQENFDEGDYIEATVKQDSGSALNLLATRYSPILAVRFRRGSP